VTPPPVRAPRPAVSEPALTGKRLVVATDSEALPGMTDYQRDLVAASEVFTEGNRAWVRIVTEEAWWTWRQDDDPGKSPACPNATAYPAEFCWVE
jgi:hypothetical protein